MYLASGWPNSKTSGREQRSLLASSASQPETSAIANRCAEDCLSCASTGVLAYRVYYALDGQTCVLLLCGGDKRKQSSDIKRAAEYLNDYLKRTRKR